MYFTDRGIEELEARRGEEEVSLAWVAARLQEFVDLNPEFEIPVERLATWLARLDDEDEQRARLVGDGWAHDRRAVRRIENRPAAEVDRSAWPFTLPPVAQLLRDGLDLPTGVTFLVGENGSGKSTLVEGVAMAFGLSPEGGSTLGRHSTRESESPLHKALRLDRRAGAPRWGFFLRAETMHGWYTFLEENPRVRGRAEPRYHEMSHGEGFLEVLKTRFDSPGLYVLDEPEAALSFTSCLALVGVLHDLAADGAQVLCATHSPLLAALPGAHILELDDDGYHETSWDDLALVDHWRRYLADPRAYLRHVLE